MIYYLQHIDLEGPGTLGGFFAEQGFSSQAIALHRGDRLPQDFDVMQAVVVLGGPMNVDEDDRYPFLRQEKKFIQELIARGILTVGLCLGAQLIARAAGARVYKSPVKELGMSRIALTEQGLRDPLFEGVEQENHFFQWHEDTFDVPDGGILLGRGEDCPNQIFKIGSKAYGFQCHMEISRDEALAWADAYVKDPQERADLKARFDREFNLHQEKLCQTAKKTYNNLLKLM